MLHYAALCSLTLSGYETSLFIPLYRFFLCLSLRAGKLWISVRSICLLRLILLS